MANTKKCPICSALISCSEVDITYSNIECEYCGKYKLVTEDLKYFDKNKLSLFLFYNRLPNTTPNGKDYYLIGKNQPIQKFDYQALTPDIISAWWPQKFSEKVDDVLLRLEKQSKYNGQEFQLTWEESIRLFFVNLFLNNFESTRKERYEQLRFIFEYMSETQHYFSGKMAQPASDSRNVPMPILKDTPGTIKIQHEGLKRIDELQKNQVNNKNVFVAMSFAEDMQLARDAICTEIVFT